MRINKTPWAILGAVLLALCACSRQQSDWQKTRETNTADSYELFIKKYPSGEFTAQAQARLKELYDTLRISEGQLEALTGIVERRWWEPGYPLSQGAIAAVMHHITAGWEGAT